VDYAPAIEGKLNPRPLKDGGAPAAHFKIETTMMNQHFENWLLADDPQHRSFPMGLANIELKRGAASSVVAGPSRTGILPSGKDEAVDLDETLFALRITPQAQMMTLITQSVTCR